VIKGVGFYFPNTGYLAGRLSDNVFKDIDTLSDYQNLRTDLE
jgi:hypothetical protein